MLFASQVAAKAFQYLLVLSLLKPEDEEYKSFSQEVKQRSLRDYGYDYGDNEVQNSLELHEWNGLSPVNRAMLLAIACDVAVVALKSRAM